MRLGLQGLPQAQLIDQLLDLAGQDSAKKSGNLVLSQFRNFFEREAFLLVVADPHQYCGRIDKLLPSISLITRDFVARQLA